MKRIHPLCKFIGIFVPAILLAFFYRPLLNLTVFGVCMLALGASRVSLKSAAAVLLPVLAVAVGLFITGYQFSSDTALGINREIFTDQGVYNGLQLSSRVLAFAGLGMLFSLTTDGLAFVRSLEQQCKIPPKFAYGVLAAWGLLPGMGREYAKARAAFYARGIRPGYVSPALITPLLVKSVRWSEALAAAMESKGFGGGARSRYGVLKIGAGDVLFPVGSILLTVMGLVFCA